MTDTAFPPPSALSRLWRADALLTALGLVMLAALAGSAVGLALDSRMIGGAPAWLKPAKFGLSTAIYSFTLAWVFEWLPDWPRVRRVASLTTTVVFVIEVVVIDLQAWRGTTSHFNVATLPDAALFAVMGIAIAVQTLATTSVAYALWRQPIADRAMGAALRAGMLITLVGAASGGLMTVPTDTQLREARATNQMAVSGAHTVGAGDGGAGLPGTGWSLEHGDLRVPHFVGLHGLQVLLLMAIAIRGRLSRVAALGVMRAFAASYTALFAILLIQASRGEPLVAPSRPIAALFGGWMIATAVVLITAAKRRGDAPESSALAEA